MARKQASKRQTLQMKYKIQKRTKEYKRKLKKAGKKLGPNGGEWKSKREAAIPNDWPFKDQMLSEIERQKGLEAEAAEKNKAARKAAAAQKKKDAAAGVVPKAKESMLPRGMGAPIPPTAAESNAILLDAYTKRVWREIKQVVEESDVVLEVLDVRDPLGSRCLEVEQWAHGKLLERTAKKSAAAAASDAEPTPKPIILVLNKVDLVPVSVTQAWLDFFQQHDPTFPIVAFHSNKALEESAMKGQVISPKELCPGAEALTQLIANVAAEATASAASSAAASGSGPRPIKVGIIGFANVGKSSLLNNLARTHAAGVGPIGGYTKELSRFKLAKGIYGLDSPAVPTSDHGAPGPHIALPLSNNRIKDDVAGFIRHFDADNLQSVLQIPRVENFEGFLDALARKVNMMKGAELNHVLAARKLLKDWNAGKIPFFTAPPEMDDEEEEEDADMEKPEPSGIQSFFTTSNRRTLQSLRAQGKIPPEAAYLVVEGSLFDEVEDEDEDEEGEDEDEEGEDDEEDEDMQEGSEDEEEEEEEEEPVPPPRKGKGKQAQAQAPPAKKAALVAAPAPTPLPAAASGKKGKAAAAAAAPAPAPAAASTKKGKAAAAAPTPAPAAAAAPAARAASGASRKRPAPKEEEEAEEAEEVAPAPTKKHAAPSKANANKPAPKSAQKAAPAPKPAAAAASPAPAAKSAKKGRAAK